MVGARIGDLLIQAPGPAGYGRCLWSSRRLPRRAGRRRPGVKRYHPTVQQPNRACASTSKTKDDPKRHGSTAREPSRRRRARQWVAVATYRRLRTRPTPLVVHDPQPSGA